MDDIVWFRAIFKVVACRVHDHSGGSRARTASMTVSITRFDAGHLVEYS